MGVDGCRGDGWPLLLAEQDHSKEMRARPLEGDEKERSRGRVFESGLRPSPTETAWLGAPDATVKSVKYESSRLP